MAIRNRVPDSSSSSKTYGNQDPITPSRQLLGANQETRDQDPTSPRQRDGIFKQHAGEGEKEEKLEMEKLSKTSQWIVLAVASGACAAFNGVFAKLTTTELTSTFSTWITNSLGLTSIETGVEVIVRALFFGLNIIFNIIMWTLYTKALSRGSSTTQVAIMNTSSNFMITAILGWAIFSEALPPLWWAGAGLLVAGSVITGRACKEEDDVKEDRVDGEEGLLAGADVELEEDEAERKRRMEEEDILNLGSDDDLITDLR